jgi:hypothetical protein
MLLLQLTMPAVEHLKKKEDKHDKTPPVHTMVVQFGTDGHWSVCTNADTEPNEEGVVTLWRSNPLTRYGYPTRNYHVISVVFQ